jgi:hypothetical protein
MKHSLGLLLVLLAATCARQTAMSPDTGAGPVDAAACPQECLRAVRCVTSCGAPPVTVGCCPCAAPAFDDIRCR